MTYTQSRPAQVFDHTTTEAQIGDYFALPQQPIMRVIALIDIGDYVSYLVQAGNNKPEQWDIMKPVAELVEQERNRLDAEEIEQYEQEMSEIIYQSSEKEILEAIGLIEPLAQYDWATEPQANEPPKMKAPSVQPKKIYYEQTNVQIWNLNYSDYVQLGLNKFILVDRTTQEVLAIRQCYQSAAELRSEIVGF